MTCWAASTVRQLSADAVRLLSPSAAAGAAVEIAWWSVHLATYPWGLVPTGGWGLGPPGRYRLDDLGPAERGLYERRVETAGTPILLVHGMVDNQAIFAVLRHRLRRRGFRALAINYPPITNDVRAAARAFAARVEAVVAETGYERVHVIGHSMGGLIARYYVQRLNGDARVHTLVTIGTPHSGTVYARLLPLRVGRQLRPGSDLMTELAEPAPTCRTRFLNVWSDMDQIIVPHDSARLDHPDLMATNVRIPGAGHLSLPRVRTVAHEIAALLIALDSEGDPEIV